MRAAIGYGALSVISILLGGCGGKGGAPRPPSPPPGECQLVASSPTLPSVTLTVSSDRCRYKSGQAGKFDYRFEVASSVDYEVATGNSCGSCDQSPNPTAFPSVKVVVGQPAGVHFCRCDEGCCPPERGGHRTLMPGTYPGSIDWPGRQWNGPSDTQNPLGAPFPVGSYDVTVSLALPGVGTLAGSLPIIVE